MLIEEIRDLYDRWERREARFPRMRREEAGRVVRQVPEGPGEDGVLLWSDLGDDPAGADEAIRAQVAHFKGLGIPFEWKLFSHDRPADLKDRLTRAGFGVGEDEAVLALELAELPPALAAAAEAAERGLAPGGAGGVSARRVEDEAGLRDYLAAHAEAWPESEPEWVESIVRTWREEPTRLSLWVAYVDGEPACSCRIEFPPASPFASLWGGGTAPRFRKRGAYTAVLAARAREAIGRGYRFLTIDASPMSRPIAERHGFRLLAISNPCESPA